MSHGFGIEYEIIVKDRNGKIVGRRKGRNSLLTNFALGFFQYALGSSSGLVAVSGVDTSGAAGYIGATYSTGVMMPASASAGDDTYGILVGTGTNVVTPADYSLQTKIAHGTGAGQLSYAGTSVLSPVTVGSTRYFDITRNFSNSSGADITINEIGYAVQSLSTYYIMMARDKLTSGLVVPNLGTAHVRYRLSATV